MTDGWPADVITGWAVSARGSVLRIGCGGSHIQQETWVNSQLALALALALKVPFSIHSQWKAQLQGSW